MRSIIAAQLSPGGRGTNSACRRCASSTAKLENGGMGLLLSRNGDCGVNEPMVRRSLSDMGTRGTCCPCLARCAMVENNPGETRRQAARMGAMSRQRNVVGAGARAATSTARARARSDESAARMVPWERKTPLNFLQAGRTAGPEQRRGQVLPGLSSRRPVTTSTAGRTARK